jgi:hypothetical protein
MTLAFWPFEKKPEVVKPEQVEPDTKVLVDLAELIPQIAEARELLYNGDEKIADGLPCPSEHKTFKVCACMDCPKRDTCGIEADHRAVDCRIKFTRVCSIKNCGKPTGYEKIILDAVISHAMKKIEDEEENWMWKKPKEKEKMNERKEIEGAGV